MPWCSWLGARSIGAVPWCRWLGARSIGAVPWCSWLGARSIAKPVHFGYVVDRVALGRILLRVL